MKINVYICRNETTKRNDMNIQKIITRSKTISTFKYTNQTSTEKSWIIKTMKQYVDEYGKPEMFDESEVATAWYALRYALDALKSNEY